MNKNSLNGRKISDSYHNIVQRVGGFFYDGDGNLIGSSLYGPQGFQGWVGPRGVQGPIGTGSSGDGDNISGIYTDGNGAIGAESASWLINDDGSFYLNMGNISSGTDGDIILAGGNMTGSNSLLNLGNALGEDWPSHIRFVRGDVSGSIDARIAVAEDGLIFKNFDSGDGGYMFSFRDPNDLHLWDMMMGGRHLFNGISDDENTSIQVAGGIRLTGGFSSDNYSIFSYLFRILYFSFFLLITIIFHLLFPYF